MICVFCISLPSYLPIPFLLVDHQLCCGRDLCIILNSPANFQFSQPQETDQLRLVANEQIWEAFSGALTSLMLLSRKRRDCSQNFGGFLRRDVYWTGPTREFRAKREHALMARELETYKDIVRTRLLLRSSPHALQAGAFPKQMA